MSEPTAEVRRCDGCLHYRKAGPHAGYCQAAHHWAPLSPALTMAYSRCKGWQAKPVDRYPLVQLVDGGCVPPEVMAAHAEATGGTE